MLTTALFAAHPAPGQSAAPRPAEPLLRVESYHLASGLHVVLAPDAQAQQVSVETWFRAGTRYDPPGRRGMSHLFEHMFSALAAPLDTASARVGRARVGDSNAQTRRDHSRYFLKVDPSGLEYALAIHASRMLSSDTLIDDALIRRTVDVVVNEGRGGASADIPSTLTPYWLMQRGAYGDGHPYALAPETEASVRAATVAELRAFYRAHSDPSTAILIVTGNVDTGEARRLIDKWFGGLASHRPPVAIETRAELPADRPARAERVAAALAAPHLYRRWAVPGLGDPESELADLVVRLLAHADGGWAAMARSSLVGTPRQTSEFGQLASDVTVDGDVADEQAAALALDNAVTALSRNGPDAAALRRAKDEWELDLMFRMERLGFQASRSEVLGEGAMMTGDPEAYRRRMAHVRSATAGEVAHVAVRWFAGRGYTLTATPIVAREAVRTGAVPTSIGVPDLAPQRVPAAWPASLPNGLQIFVTTRNALPLARVTLMVGRASDTAGRTMAAALRPAGYARQVRTTASEAATGVSISLRASLADSAIAAMASLRDAVPAHGQLEIYVTGSVDSLGVLRAATAAFGNWPARTDLPASAPRTVDSGVAVRHEAGRTQTKLTAEWRVNVSDADSDIATRIARRTLAALVNSVLRTEKGWSYGATGVLRAERGSVVLAIESEVQSDRAGDAIVELRRAVDRFRSGEAPALTPATLASALSLELMNDTETLASLERLAMDSRLVRGDANATFALAPRLAAITDSDIARARQLVGTATMALTVRGDTTQMMAQLIDRGIVIRR
jgi:predicted Zn-dependent peptidase